jgi:hypothetical protein
MEKCLPMTSLAGKYSLFMALLSKPNRSLSQIRRVLSDLKLMVLDTPSLTYDESTLSLSDRLMFCLILYINATLNTESDNIPEFACVINELSEDWAAARFDYPQKALRDASTQRVKVDYAEKEGRGKKRVTVKVSQIWDLAVQISRPDQVELDEGEGVEHLKETSHGTRSRGNKSPHLRCMRY